ncbi:uncharacterized protein LOC100575045 [Acyrthosiphon pisum]|uniref:THAP-type domain-containing protein n=1 Tax=Acyrthosiphon pisum TaxID=7029 RepID=A0A8R1W799_ACYPI|nr:uncharacterized protein LOC100575045 [Acyrthosiphon pisum]|eukprot:XP_003242072.1 PREDICTED: uncharacterized protein LOC100575045 [Acyrthosiphon pisum]
MSNVCLLCEKPVLKYSISKVSLHAFPSCPKKRQIWLNQCKLANEKILPNRKICSIHFEPRCFNTSVKRRVLYRDAVPTIFGNGHAKTTNLPLKITKGRPKNCTKNGIVVQKSKSLISLPKAAKKVVADQNRESRAVKQRAHFDRFNSILDSEVHEINELRDFLTELNKAKSSLPSLLELLLRKKIILGNLI